jgi:predicted component of type VI protein secretion system
MTEYYTLPLRLDDVIRKKQHRLCTLKESVAQNVYLIVTTQFAESRYDETYGCVVWEQEFESISRINWIDAAQPSIKKAIIEHEKRLTNVDVFVDIENYELVLNKTIRIKKRITVRVKAVLAKTNEPYEFAERIYVSPMSIN